MHSRSPFRCLSISLEITLFLCLLFTDEPAAVAGSVEQASSAEYDKRAAAVQIIKALRRSECAVGFL